MSGGGSSSPQQSTSLPDWAVPYAQQYMDRGAALGGGTFQPYTGQRYTDNNALQNQGIQQTAAQATGGSAVNNAASSNLTNTLNGQYMNSNPYLDQTVQKAQDDVIRGYNQTTRPQLDAMDARSGSFGNSGVAQTGQEQQRQLGETLGNVSTNIRGADYANERNRQLQAASLAPGAAAAGYNDSQQLFNAGSAQSAPQQRNLDFQYSQYQDAQNDPYRRLTATGAPFGANLGSVTQGSGGSKAGGILGGALAGSQLGSSYGGWGSAIGGGLGGIAGGK